MRRAFLILAALFALFPGCPARAASDIQLPEMLLAAMPQTSDIRKTSGHDGWWQEPPEFLGRLDPATGLRTLVLQSFRLPEQGTRERIMMAISAYVSPEAAHARFNDMEPQDNRAYGQTQTLAQTHKSEQMRLHSTARPRGQTLRVQEGRYILRVTHWTDGLPLTPAQMAQLAHLSIDRLSELDREKRPLPAPPPLAKHLPQETPKLAKPLGTAAGPIEWAAFDRALGENVPDPSLKDFLDKTATPPMIALRRWPLTTAPPGQVVDAMLFRLADAKSALRYLVLERENRLPERLQLSPMAKLPSYMELSSGERGTKISLVFAKERTVGILTCGAPYFFASEECKPALLELADIIAASLTQ